MKQITISLRDEELEVIEKLEKSLGLVRHQVVKLAIRRFLFPKEKEKIPLDGAYARVVDTIRLGNADSIAELDKARERTPKEISEAVEVLPPCEICDSAEPYPEEGYLKHCPEKELKEKGLKKYSCSRCGRVHITPIENIVITESLSEKEKRVKLEKARAEAEAYINSASDPMDKILREGMVRTKLKSLRGEK